MRIGYAVGYWKQGPPKGALKAIRTAERLGYESVWTAEAYGSDAFTPLAWWGSRTTRIKLGTGIAQLSARTPTAAAMAALTLDHLSGGRVILGLGASGPQVVEGWYGAPYPKPLARSREYIDVVRQVLARQSEVTSAGPHYPLPYTGPDATGLGKPLRSTVHPLRADLPIYLAAEGPKNVALAAEIADGWLPFLFSPKADAEARAQLEEGFALRSTSLGQWRSREDMVDPPPFVGGKGTGSTVVEKRELLAIWIQFAEHIFEAPRNSLPIGIARVFVVADMFQMFLRAVDINGSWGHIHVSTPDRRLLRGKMRFEVFP